MNFVEDSSNRPILRSVPFMKLPFCVRRAEPPRCNQFFLCCCWAAYMRNGAHCKICKIIKEADRTIAPHLKSRSEIRTSMQRERINAPVANSLNLDGGISHVILAQRVANGFGNKALTAAAR